MTPKPTGTPPSPSPLRIPRFSRRWAWSAFRRWLLTTTRPILVGPFRGEVGFEALYWIPFVQQLVAAGVDPQRIIPLTRGGMGALYGGREGLDLYALRTLQEVRIENRIQHARTGLLKQTHVTAWDRAILQEAAQRLALVRPAVLHPSWMYQVLWPFWEQEAGPKHLLAHALYGPLPVPPLPAGVTLPEPFVAVRFYFRFTYPANPQTIAFAKETIRQLATQQPVVLLNSGCHVDDHLDFVPRDLPNVHRMTDLLPVTPENNLALQAAVIARSLGFIGTYGGLAQLALRYRKPVVSYYTEWGGTAWAHRHLSEILAHGSGAPFQLLRVGDLPLIQQVTPTVTLHGSS